LTLPFFISIISFISFFYYFDCRLNKITFLPERYLIWCFFLDIFIDFFIGYLLGFVYLFLKLVLVEFKGVVHVAIVCKLIGYFRIRLVF